MKFRVSLLYLPLLILTASCQEDPLIQALEDIETKAYRNRACELIFLNENPIEVYVKRELEEHQINSGRSDLLYETSTYSWILRDTVNRAAEDSARRKRLEDSQKGCLSYQQEKNIAIGEAAKLGASREQIGYLQISGRTKAEQEDGAVSE